MGEIIPELEPDNGLPDRHPTPKRQRAPSRPSWRDRVVDLGGTTRLRRLHRRRGDGHRAATPRCSRIGNIHGQGESPRSSRMRQPRPAGPTRRGPTPRGHRDPPTRPRPDASPARRDPHLGPRDADTIGRARLSAPTPGRPRARGGPSPIATAASARRHPLLRPLMQYGDPRPAYRARSPLAIGLPVLAGLLPDDQSLPGRDDHPGLAGVDPGRGPQRGRRRGRRDRRWPTLAPASCSASSSSTASGCSPRCAPRGPAPGHCAGRAPARATRSCTRHQTLGFIVPGLIAYQLVRQPDGRDAVATGTVSLATYGVLASGLLLGLVPAP